MLCDLFFFFSSRRRHTRLQGDWSSDVCSSDLRTAIGWTEEPASEIPADVINAFGPDATPYLISSAYFRESIPTLRGSRSEEHTSELQSPCNLVCRLLLEKKKIITKHHLLVTDQ